MMILSGEVLNLKPRQELDPVSKAKWGPAGFEQSQD